MIQCKYVNIKYKEGNSEFIAVNNVSLTFESGSFTSIVGRSGSGKTSLLNAMGGLLPPTNGKILVNGTNIYKYSERKLSEYRNRHIGYIFQNFYLEHNYTVKQNIEIALMIAGYPTKKRREKIEELLTVVGMEKKQKQLVASLSGGERQRVCIARALANNPPIILADEPCGNLDTQNGAVIMEHLYQFSREGKTVVLVTHNLEDAKKSDRIIELEDGRVVSEDILGN